MRIFQVFDFQKNLTYFVHSENGKCVKQRNDYYIIKFWDQNLPWEAGWVSHKYPAYAASVANYVHYNVLQ